MRSHNEIKKVNLTIPKNFFLFDSNKQKNQIKNHTNKEKEDQDLQSSNFHFFKNFKIKNPVTLKENNKIINQRVKRQKTSSFEINFFDININNQLTTEKYENLPKIKNKTNHVMSKSQINFKSILSDSNNLIGNRKYNSSTILCAKAGNEKTSAPLSKQSKRVVFTKCVDERNNYNIFGKRDENEKQSIEAACISNNNDNGSFNYNGNIKNYLSIPSNISNNNFLVDIKNNNNNNRNNFNKYENDYFDEAKSDLAGAEASLQMPNNNSRNQVNFLNISTINNENNIQMQESVLGNLVNIDSSKKEKLENNHSINVNNSNSNLSPNLDQSSIKPRKIKSHFRNLSTNIKILDLNLKGIYDKIPDASTDRTKLYENKISKNLTKDKTHKSYSNDNSLSEDSNKKITIRNEIEGQTITKNPHMNIQEKSIPYTVDFLNENRSRIKEYNSLSIIPSMRKSIISSFCNASTSTNTDFQKRAKDVKNLFNIGQQTKKLHLHFKQKAKFR